MGVAPCSSYETLSTTSYQQQTTEQQNLPVQEQPKSVQGYTSSTQGELKLTEVEALGEPTVSPTLKTLCVMFSSYLVHCH
jgi:hypothetical protein